MLRTEADVVIVGAGPSGATLATLLKKHRPATSVLVLEKERFPRHKIGESLLVDVNRILVDMGVFEAVEAAGFSRKYGATFIWGDGRDPFHFLWKDGARIVRQPRGYQLDYTWHVDRSAYDGILVGRAREMGAEVLEGYAASGVLVDGERVTGVTVVTPEGEEREVRARIVVDCANAHGPVHRRLSGKRLDENLRNVALYGYLRGVRSHPDLNGVEEKRTLILTHPEGWVWVIPLRDGITSVGFVTTVESFRKREPLDPVERYREILASLREHDVLFAGSELVDYHGDGRLVRAIQEYSYQCERIGGPGWVTCGNAAGFVDAILSIGVYVAQTHAQFLACALRSVLDGDVEESVAIDCYATTVSENLAAFRAVAHMFYAFNTSMSDWWRACSAQLRQSTLVPSAGDKGAFIAFFTGLSARSAIYEEAVNAFGGSFLLDVSAQLFGDSSADHDVFGDELAAEAAGARALIKRDPVLSSVAEVRTRPFVLPDVGQGRLCPVTRMDITTRAGGPDLSRRLYLPIELAAVPALLDGTRRLSDVARALGGDPTTRADVMKLAYRLACMGAVEETGRPP